MKPLLHKYGLILHNTSLLTFFLFLPYGKIIPTISITTCIILSPLLNLNSWEMLKSNFKIFLPYTSLFSLFIISYFVIDDTPFFEVQKRIGLFLIPLYFLSRNISQQQLYNYLKSFITGVSILNIISFYRITSYYIEHKTLHLANGELVNYLTVIPRPYLGFFLVISSLMCYHLFNTSKARLWLIILAFHTFETLIINARAALVILLIITFIILLLKISQSFSYKKLLLLIIPIVLSILPFLNPSFLKRINEMTYNEPRSIIWPCTLEKIYSFTPKEILTGTFSTQKTQTVLNECYESLYINNDRWGWLWEHHYLLNTHNQYLDYLLTFGLIGLTFFLWIILPGFMFPRKNATLFYLCLIISLTCIFENILSRQWGIYTIASLLPILYIKKK